MTPDKLTTYLGIALAALHQATAVGVMPQTTTDWLQSAASVALGLFGYFTNKG